MKQKLFTFLLALVASVGTTFAARDVVPSDTVLKNYYKTGQLCVCIFVPADIACNDVVFVGTYNRDAKDAWITDVNKLAKFQPVEGYDGWYVVAVNDETPADFEYGKGIQGKPIVLDQNGAFNWQYQIGAATKIRGGVEIVTGTYGGEIDLIRYTKDAPNVYTIDALKVSNPCTAVYHNYTFTVISDGCDGSAVPYLIGDMTDWKFQQMQLNEAKTQELGAPVYYYNIKCAEGMEYQMVSGLKGADGAIIEQPSWDNDSYLLQLVDDVWVRYTENGNVDLTTGANVNITFDVRQKNLRWARCADVAEGTGTGEASTDVVFTAVDFAGQGVSGTGGAVSATKDGVTFTCDKGFGDGTYGVRCYKGSTVTITSATEQIGKIEFDFDTVSGKLYDGYLDPVTVVNAKEWTVTLPSQARMNKISIYFGTAEAVGYDTVTVAEALVIGETLADNSYSDKKYAVVGYVASIEDPYSPDYGNITIWLTDDPTSTYGDIQAYRAKCTEEVGKALVPGDHVTVVGKIEKYVGNSGTPTIDIIGGKVVKNPFWFQYTIKGIANIEEAGTVIIDRTPIYYCHKITAAPNYGYHFVKWNDGNTENPRSFILTQDTVFTAEFAPNIYSFNVTWDEDLGNVQATDGSFDYLTPLTISATPNYGYHFVRWSDGNTDNPRTYVLKDNVTLKAIFAPNVYSISALNNPEGTVNGTGSFNYLTECSIEAVPNYGYHFVKWNDGVIDNPRTVILTQDTIFAPIYSLSKKGKCGDELALTWEYDALTKTLTISGSGTLNSNYTFGIEAPTNVERLIIAEGVTTIGGGAFANYVSIKHISVAASVKTIYEQAFYNCIGLQEIYSYRATPATAYSTTFDGIEKFDCVLHVLASSIDMYKFATGWRDFYYVEAIGVDNTTTDEIVVTPSENEANVIWPTVSGAASYELVIKDKSGNIVCTLIFNANGQLTSIAFNAPSRNGVPAQTQSAGFSFTVTGLDSGTGYDLTLTAKDNSDNAIQTETISFVTTDGNVSTDIDQLQGNKVQSTKVIKDGQVLILRNGKTYTMQGQEVK